MDIQNITRKDIETLNVIEPFEFETEREEQWFNVGLKYGLGVADTEPKSVWIDVKEDLPCNHEHLYELTGKLLYTKKVLILLSDGQVKIDYMLYNDLVDQWKWGGQHSEVLFWSIIPEF